jgi:hypothetical protein
MTPGDRELVNNLTRVIAEIDGRIERLKSARESVTTLIFEFQEDVSNKRAMQTPEERMVRRERSGSARQQCVEFTLETIKAHNGQASLDTIYEALPSKIHVTRKQLAKHLDNEVRNCKHPRLRRIARNIFGERPPVKAVVLDRSKEEWKSKVEEAKAKEHQG